MLQNFYVFLYIRSYNLWTETILLLFYIFLVLFFSLSCLNVLVIPVLCWLEVVKTDNLALILILKTFSISPLKMMFSEWFSWKKVKVKVKLLSCVQLFATPWTVAYQAPPSMVFSRQEYWSGLPFPSPGDLPNIFAIYCWGTSLLLHCWIVLWKKGVKFCQMFFLCQLKWSFFFTVLM